VSTGFHAHAYWNASRRQIAIKDFRFLGVFQSSLSVIPAFCV
jgi:hypothetical protein